MVYLREIIPYLHRLTLTLKAATSDTFYLVSCVARGGQRGGGLSHVSGEQAFLQESHSEEQMMCLKSVIGMNILLSSVVMRATVYLVWTVLGEKQNIQASAAIVNVHPILLPQIIICYVCLFCNLGFQFCFKTRLQCLPLM